MAPDAAASPPLPNPPSPLLTLPRDVRYCIYDVALEWPDLSEAAKGIPSEQGARADHESSERPLCMIPRPHLGSMSTPPLLLLSRQITNEALEILYQKPLILASTPPYIKQLAKPMDITEFISERTLQNLRGAKCWLKTIEMLLDIWYVANKLESLEVHTKYTALSRDLGWTFEQAAHHRHVIGLLSRLRGFGEQVPVIFVGEVPEERMKRNCVEGQGKWYDVIDWN